MRFRTAPCPDFLALEFIQVYNPASYVFSAPVIIFIILQLVGLTIAGYFPPIVNYLPNRTYLTSENAPPPINPKLQQCMEEDLFVYYDLNEESIRNGVAQFSQTNFDYLRPD